MRTAFVLVFVSLAALAGDVAAQNRSAVDSLTVLLATRVGPDRYSPLYDLVFLYLDKDNDKALTLVEEAEEAALLSGDSLWIVKSKRVRGQILYKLQRIPDASKFLQQSLGIARRNGFDRECKYIYSTLGLTDLFQGELDKALRKFDAALQLAGLERDTVFLISNLNNIGLTYFQLNDAEKALTYYLNALKLKQLAQPAEIDWSMVGTNISLCYSSLGEFSNAMTYLKKSLDEYGDDCPEELRMYQKLASGAIFYGLKQYDTALREFFASLSLARKVHNSRLAFDNLVKISAVLIAQHRIIDAERYLKDAEHLAANNGYFPIGQVNIYAQFCQVYQHLSNYRRLAFYQHKYIQLNDSIFSRQLTSRLMTAEAEFKERENKARIETQSQIISLNKGIILRQKRLNILAALLAAVTFTFAVFVFINSKRKQHLNKLLEQKVRERTQALEHSRNEMRKALQAKDIRMKQVSAVIVDTVNSIDGLCVTGAKEVSLSVVHSYLQRIRQTSKEVVGNVQQWIGEGPLQYTR
jgi:tetratricopeptide (TPR) repeat protein